MKIKYYLKVNKKVEQWLSLPDWSTTELSKVLGVTRQTIYNWQHDISHPSPQHVAKINNLKAHIDD